MNDITDFKAIVDHKANKDMYDIKIAISTFDINNVLEAEFNAILSVQEDEFIFTVYNGCGGRYGRFYDPKEAATVLAKLARFELMTADLANDVVLKMNSESANIAFGQDETTKVLMIEDVIFNWLKKMVIIHAL